MLLWSTLRRAIHTLFSRRKVCQEFRHCLKTVLTKPGGTTQSCHDNTRFNQLLMFIYRAVFFLLLTSHTRSTWQARPQLSSQIARELARDSLRNKHERKRWIILGSFCRTRGEHARFFESSFNYTTLNRCLDTNVTRQKIQTLGDFFFALPLWPDFIR